MGMGKRGRAEGKGKERNSYLIGKMKGGAITTSAFGSLFAGLELENSLFGTFLCSAESTSMVATSAVGVLGVFARKTESDPPVKWLEWRLSVERFVAWLIGDGDPAVLGEEEIGEEWMEKGKVSSFSCAPPKGARGSRWVKHRTSHSGNFCMVKIKDGSGG